MEVLLLGVGLLGAAVGVAEDGAENCQRDGVVESSAEGNGRGLDRREVYASTKVSAASFFAVAGGCSRLPRNPCNGWGSRAKDLQWREAIVTVMDEVVELGDGWLRGRGIGGRVWISCGASAVVTARGLLLYLRRLRLTCQ